MESLSKWLWRWGMVMLSLPLVTALLCASFYWRARWSLGYAPSYGNPDPKQLDWPVHQSLVMLGLVFLLPAMLSSFCLGGVLVCRREKLRGLVCMVLSALIFGVFLLLGKVQVVDEFMAWILD